MMRLGSWECHEWAFALQRAALPRTAAGGFLSWTARLRRAEGGALSCWSRVASPPHSRRRLPRAFSRHHLCSRASAAPRPPPRAHFARSGATDERTNHRARYEAPRRAAKASSQSLSARAKAISSCSEPFRPHSIAGDRKARRPATRDERRNPSTPCRTVRDRAAAQARHSRETTSRLYARSSSRVSASRGRRSRASRQSRA